MKLKYGRGNEGVFCLGDLYYEPSEASVLVYTKNGWEYINSPIYTKESWEREYINSPIVESKKLRLCQSCGAPVENGNRCSYCGVLY